MELFSRRVRFTLFERRMNIDGVLIIHFSRRILKWPMFCPQNLVKFNTVFLLILKRDRDRRVQKRPQQNAQDGHNDK